MEILFIFDNYMQFSCLMGVNSWKFHQHLGILQLNVCCYRLFALYVAWDLFCRFCIMLVLIQLAAFSLLIVWILKMYLFGFCSDLERG